MSSHTYSADLDTKKKLSLKYSGIRDVEGVREKKKCDGERKSDGKRWDNPMGGANIRYCSVIGPGNGVSATPP